MATSICWKTYINVENNKKGVETGRQGNGIISVYPSSTVCYGVFGGVEEYVEMLGGWVV